MKEPRCHYCDWYADGVAEVRGKARKVCRGCGRELGQLLRNWKPFTKTRRKGTWKKSKAA